LPGGPNLTMVREAHKRDGAKFANVRLGRLAFHRQSV